MCATFFCPLIYLDLIALTILDKGCKFKVPYYFTVDLGTSWPASNSMVLSCGELPLEGYITTPEVVK
jgi:hypothetical protein